MKGESLWAVEGLAVFTVATYGDDALPDSVEFRDAFKEAAARLNITSGAISIVLPDSDSGVSILDFDEGLPQKKDDAIELVRWRASKGLFLKPSECRIDYRVLSKDSGGGARVLISAMKKTVVDFYEDVFEAGVEGDKAFTVSKIGVASFGLWNLTADKLSAEGATEKDFVLIVRRADGFTFMAFKDGLLNFYRAKKAGDDKVFAKEVSSSFLYLSDMEVGMNISRVYFLGMEGAGEALKEVVDMPVETIDPSTMILGGAPSVADDDDNDAGLTPMEILSSVGGLV